MDIILVRSIFDFLISFFLVIPIVLTAIYYRVTKIADYLVFSMFFLIICIHTFIIGLDPFIPISLFPNYINSHFIAIMDITWFNIWHILFFHDVLFFSINKRIQKIIIFEILALNAVYIYYFFNSNFRWIILSPYSIFILFVTLITYFFYARISEINLLMTRKVRNL